MIDTAATGNYCTINSMTLITGLTDRTIRNYIASGILQGEKINGLWHFTPEQVKTFLAHPAVRPSILAKQNGIVYDFLLDGKKSSQQACIILDLPDVDHKETAEFFCYTICNGDYQDIQFTLDGVQENLRIILKGDAKNVLDLVNRYYTR